MAVAAALLHGNQAEPARWSCTKLPNSCEVHASAMAAISKSGNGTCPCIQSLRRLHVAGQPVKFILCMHDNVPLLIARDKGRWRKPETETLLASTCCGWRLIDLHKDTRPSLAEAVHYGCAGTAMTAMLTMSLLRRRPYHPGRGARS